MSCPLHRMPFSLLSRSPAFIQDQVLVYHLDVAWPTAPLSTPQLALLSASLSYFSFSYVFCFLLGTDVLSLSFYHINIECPLLCIALDVGDNTGGQDRHEPCIREDRFWERREKFSPQPLIELIFMISSQEMVVEEVVVQVEIVAT